MAAEEQGQSDVAAAVAVVVPVAFHAVAAEAYMKLTRSAITQATIVPRHAIGRAIAVRADESPVAGVAVLVAIPAGHVAVPGTSPVGHVVDMAT